MKRTSIQLSEKTKIQLAKFGTKLSTWDSILTDLMNHSKKCQQFWEDRL